MALATMCTLKPMLEIHIVISFYYVKNSIKSPLSCPASVNNPNFVRLSSYGICCILSVLVRLIALAGHCQ